MRVITDVHDTADQDKLVKLILDELGKAHGVTDLKLEDLGLEAVTVDPDEGPVD